MGKPSIGWRRSATSSIEINPARPSWYPRSSATADETWGTRLTMTLLKFAGGNLSHLQLTEVGNAGLHQWQVHLYKVILDAGSFCRGKNSFPVERVLTDGHDLASLCRPALNVHGDKTARVFGKVLGGIESIADGGHLELELDEAWIEKFKQQVIGPLAVYLRYFETFVVKSLYDTCCRCTLADAVVFVGGALDVIHGGILWAVEACNKHLRQAGIFCPRDAAVLIFPQFVEREVTADATESGIVQDALEFRSFVFPDAAE